MELPDLAVLGREPLLNRERASRLMAAAGLDALVCTRAANVYYLTNVWPLRDRQGGYGSTYAVLPRDPRAPVALVMSQFSYYYGVADEGVPPGVQPFLHTAPLAPAEPGGTPGPAPPTMFRVVDPSQLGAREAHRRRVIESMPRFDADARRGLQRALAELAIPSGGNVGTDDRDAAAALEALLPKAKLGDAEETLRAVRRVKTPAELSLMRAAATANAAAAIAAARAAREAGSIRALRTRFAAEAAARGNTYVFMVVDGVHSPAVDEPLREGQALLIDCVSHCANYHGDFARTIFVGEPAPRMKQVCRAIETAWDDIRGRLRPGLRYSEVRALGASTLQRLGIDVQVGFSPHNVGLYHTDEAISAFGTDRVLDEGMVLSVDCPVLEQGGGGTAHLEDLVVIRAGGAEPLHPVGTPTITV
jgi:Xaa-Pro aminopeptidase